MHCLCSGCRPQSAFWLRSLDLNVTQLFNFPNFFVHFVLLLKECLLTLAHSHHCTDTKEFVASTTLLVVWLTEPVGTVLKLTKSFSLLVCRLMRNLKTTCVQPTSLWAHCWPWLLTRIAMTVMRRASLTNTCRESGRTLWGRPLSGHLVDTPHPRPGQQRSACSDLELQAHHRMCQQQVCY